MKTRRIISAAVALVLTGAGLLVGAGAAAAHTPAVSASCSGVRLVGTAYDAGKANRWTATVSGVTTSGTFGASVDKTIPVAQEGKTTTWSATIEAFDGSYRQSRSGTVGPCGTPPVPQQPDDEVETRERTTPPDCTTFTATMIKESRVTLYVYDKASNSWVRGTPGEWKQTSTTTREATAQECVRPPKPELSEEREVTSEPDCTTSTTTTETQVRDAVFVFTQGAWKQDGFTEWRPTGSRTNEATLQECPPPPAPKPVTDRKVDDDQKCGEDFTTVTTTTTTTGYVLDEPTRAWHLGEPVVEVTTAKQPTKRIDCPTPTADKREVAGVLPDTGAPTPWYGVVAGLLVIGGLATLLVSRRSIDWD